MNSKLLLALLAGGLVLTGCTFPSSRMTIPRAQANVMQRPETGVVTHVREVNIEGRKTRLGTFGGGALGGAAASGGSGVGGRLATAGGAVAGAVIGEAVEELATRSEAQEITIRLDNGATAVVTQESSNGLFQDGDRVRILDSGRSARVSMAVE